MQKKRCSIVGFKGKKKIKNYFFLIPKNTENHAGHKKKNKCLLVPSGKKKDEDNTVPERRPPMREANNVG